MVARAFQSRLFMSDSVDSGRPSPSSVLFLGLGDDEMMKNMSVNNIILVFRADALVIVNASCEYPPFHKRRFGFEIKVSVW